MILRENRCLLRHCKLPLQPLGAHLKTAICPLFRVENEKILGSLPDRLADICIFVEKLELIVMCMSEELGCYHIGIASDYLIEIPTPVLQAVSTSRWYMAYYVDLGNHED